MTTLRDAMVRLCDAYTRVVVMPTGDRAEEAALLCSAVRRASQMTPAEMEQTSGELSWSLGDEDGTTYQSEDLVLREGRCFLCSHDYGGSVCLEILPDLTFGDAELPEEGEES
jgi:hypothetical protein